jgi:plastocyanin
MPDIATLDRPEEAPALAPGRTERRHAARSAAIRRLLTVTAGLGVVATVLAFVALSRPAAPHKTVRLPSAKAALAAFNTGLRTAQTAGTAGRRPSAKTVKPAAVAGSVAVQIKSYAYTPAALTIKAGTKVTWTNYDTAPHTVTVDSGPVKFNSPTLQKGDSFTYTFTAPGTYSYYCAVHPDMMAKVVVTGATSTSPPSTTPTTPPTTPAPTTSPSGGMPMPTRTSGGSSDCAVSYALQTFLTHVNSAHLDESPGQQVQDILDLDSYIGNHLVLVQKMLAPATGGGLTNALSTTLSSLLIHINTGHLGESPGQQVQDILDVNQYVATHLALVQKMVSGWEAMAC